MANLFVMVGTPGSGKSTYVKENLLPILISPVYVSRDEIRFDIIKNDEEYFSHEDEVFSTFVDKIVNGLQQNTNVIADATNLNVRSREKLLNAIDRKFQKDYNIDFIVMDAPLALCQKRNAMRSGRALVPEDALRKMYNSMTIPRKSEHKNVKSILLVRDN